MDRESLGVAGIHLPALPTLVIGGLPGPPDWAERLVRIGLDVVASGAVVDDDETLARARGAVPFRPVVAMGAAATLPDGAWLVAGGNHGADDLLSVDDDDTLVGVDPSWLGRDADDVAARLLALVRDNPARWWVAARGLRDCTQEDAEALLAMLVAGVRMVRLFLMKQQFDDGDARPSP